jgi:hypothetical protein
MSFAAPEEASAPAIDIETIEAAVIIVNKLVKDEGIINLRVAMKALEIPNKKILVAVASNSTAWRNMCKKLYKTWNGSHTALCRIDKVREAVMLLNVTE